MLGNGIIGLLVSKRCSTLARRSTDICTQHARGVTLRSACAAVKSCAAVKAAERTHKARVDRSANSSHGMSRACFCIGAGGARGSNAAASSISIKLALLCRLLCWQLPPRASSDEGAIGARCGKGMGAATAA